VSFSVNIPKKDRIVSDMDMYFQWKGSRQMTVTYKKLWHMLLDKDMKKRDLQEAAKLTSYAMNKLSRDEAVTTDVLAKVCISLNCPTPLIL